MIHSRLGKRRILVAEDVELNQLIVKHMIESWGCKVAIAVNGGAAVNMIRENSYDLVLMDIQMPEMDGIQATQQIRRLPEKDKSVIPIIAFTAHLLREDMAKYIAAGMNDYLSKPFCEEKLYEMIKKHLLPNKAELMDEIPAEAPDNEVAATGKLYDLSLIESIAGGDEDFIRKMIELFIETVPANVKEMNAYLEQENWDMVSKMAHKLKSTLDSMGVQSIKQEVRTIEQSAKVKVNLDKIPELAHKVTLIVAACIRQMEQKVAV